MKPLLLYICLLLTSLTSQAQFNVMFQPQVSGRNIYGLSKALYYNFSSASIEATVVIDVRCDQQKVLQIILPKRNFLPGVNEISSLVLLKSPIKYGQSIAASILKQTGNFAEGEYEYCFSIIPGKDPSNPQDFCFSHTVMSLTPLILLNPFDGEIICDERPLFSWQPPLPMPPNSLFRLTLVRINDGQSAAEALVRNMPVFVQQNISGSILPFPTNIPSLSQGSKYAWQVAIYSSKINLITKSELWEFEVKCDNKKDSSIISYREIKAIEDGNFHIAKDELHVSLFSPYGSGNLLYKIYDLEKPSQPIQGLPKLEVQQGYNYYSLDLKKITAFKDGKQYLMQVALRSGETLKLRFIYKLNNE